MDAYINPYWIIPVILLYYYITDTARTWKSTKKYPLVGNLPALAPRFILNFLYATRASHLYRDSYRKFKDRATQIIRTEGNVVVLPYNVLDELATLPTTTAGPSEAIENELMGRYTSIGLILDSKLHHTIVQRRLTPRLPVLAPILEKTVTSAFQQCFPQADDWVEVTPYELFGRISSRTNASTLVGPVISQDPEWLDVSLKYPENCKQRFLMQTMVFLRMFPRLIQPIVAPLLPSYWKGRRCVQRIQEILYPRIQELLEAKDSGAWDPTYSTKEEDTNILSWLVETTKGNEHSPSTIIHAQILLVFASIHTTLTRIVNSLYDIIAADPSLIDELRAEIETVAIDAKGWGDMPYDRLHKLDSTLRECHRTSPTLIQGMKRLFKKSYTFRNGIHVPKGTYTAMMLSEIENDPEQTPNPEMFDALRSYREKQMLGLDNPASREYDFSTTTRTALGFGYGRTACPGRFFASLVIKMVFVKLLTEYEFRFLPGEGRPQTINLYDFLITSPAQKILVRRRAGNNCPY
ncbi:cytochrome P450 [Xylaria cf. heliscus]|nr:cytochrome P450 [Xylaria cf. heliscus]